MDPASISEPLFYRVEEAAERCRVSPSLMWELVRSGAVPSVKVGKLRRIPAGGLRAWADGLASQ